MREIAILKIDVLFELMCTTSHQALKDSRYYKLLGYVSMAESLGLITEKERDFIESAAFEDFIGVIF